MTIDKLWPESYPVFGNALISGSAADTFFVDTITNFGIVVFIILFFLFGFARIIGGLQVVLFGAFNYKNLLRIEEHTNLYTNRNTVLAFFVVVLSFMIANCGMEHPLVGGDVGIGLVFVIVLSLFLILLVFRQIVCYLLIWVNRSRIFKYIARVYYSYMVLALLFSIVGLTVYMLFPATGEAFLKIYLLCTLPVIAITYFIRANQIIISNGFSHFFWILYLCTLEILPLAVIWRIIV